MTPLNTQIINRLNRWRIKHPYITQREIASYLGISESFFSEVCSLKKNLSDENTDKLLTLTKGNGIPCKRLSSRVVLGPKSNGCRISKEAYAISKSGECNNFSANNRQVMTYAQDGSGWFAGEEGHPAATGTEAKTSIVNCPVATRSSTGNTLIDIAQQLNALQEALYKYVDVNGLIEKAKPNPNGTTQDPTNVALSRVSARFEHLQTSKK